MGSGKSDMGPGCKAKNIVMDNARSENQVKFGPGHYKRRRTRITNQKQSQRSGIQQ